MGEKKTRPIDHSKWRSSHQLRGVRAKFVGYMNRANGPQVIITEKLAQSILEVIDQAIHTEQEHEPVKTKRQQHFYYNKE